MSAPEQSAFRAALLDPTCPVPEGLGDGRGGAAGRRFDVYRNNVASSLAGALVEGFPTLCRLIGEANLHRLAQPFLRAHPPRDQRIFRYGAALPDYLAAQRALDSMPWLPDIARLDLALRSAYHAADAAPIDPAHLAALSPEDLASARLHFAPSLRLLTSDWPLHDIWRKAWQADAPQPGAAAQHILITRPDFDPVPTPLTPSASRLLRALLDGAPAGVALTDDAEVAAFTDLLSRLLAARAVTGVTIEHPQNAETLP
ncbi:HvfC/BufC N-terminal domain-containing protein [Pseudooceanicola algae]|uniref:Putative DNA-binding domain-containing protein n=1 Tax=Pseudooceanicola algae TaxID=1537215 RepID=A0A418SGP4_9RHOB|nr:DNA-binding domain-containing protein [Pseudooceanicola algae]QPM88906.1 hypothetical protein PSAL_001090 [Pseudooceanicola algae]